MCTVPVYWAGPCKSFTKLLSMEPHHEPAKAKIRRLHLNVRQACDCLSITTYLSRDNLISTIFNFNTNSSVLLQANITMAGPPAKRQKREDYRTQHRADEESTELPRKKFYRQRAHANPFSDHRLV